MDQAVFQTLTDTLSADPNARMAAELRLKELQSMPGTHVLLSPVGVTYIRRDSTRKTCTYHRQCFIQLFTNGRIEYPLSLCKLTLTRECNISQRHSAVVLLKSYIDQQWSPKSLKFRGPEPSPEVS